MNVSRNLFGGLANIAIIFNLIPVTVKAVFVYYY